MFRLTCSDQADFESENWIFIGQLNDFKINSTFNA